MSKTIGHSTTHGMTRTREWNSWTAARSRCFNPKNKDYPNYGGRGISMCKSWADSFEKFYADMGDRPDGTSIDRIDNEGDYSPGNCRWATLRQQGNNKRNNVVITHDGESLTIAQWARKTGINHVTIESRLRDGWSETDAITTPAIGNSRMLTHDGKTMCVADWAREAGMSPRTVLSRIETLGWSISDALTIEPGCVPRLLTYRGKTQTIADWAKETGLPKRLIGSRIGLGWTIEKVLFTPKQKATTVTYNGETKTFVEWSRSTGIARNVIIARIVDLGWPAEKALTTPTKKYKKRS